ncbi:MAG: mandelate racemase/muconate lactonizing enzyme family protein [Rhizobiales bacterium]|nr:mandelate racemase/muconate lactonizing enzyme family protein [Hyphomicrobiales bacterium]NRB13923.1 mandelate racemase/muconate lactonizing enzyme family protein [Hyphomicrobiales bacterium]
MLKITEIETVRLDNMPNLIWVNVKTDQGLIGLGETFFGAAAVEAHIHEYIADYLLGQNALEIERHSHRMTGYVGRGGSGAEMRAMSAVDIALWDLLGQYSNQPLYQVLGGASRDRIRVYNTCAGYNYVRKPAAQVTANFGLNPSSATGPYEDLEGFLNEAGELAQSLLDMGINGMKIWPFDFAAEASGGTYISKQQLKTAILPFEKIRAAVGDKMEIMCELHSLWNVPTAKLICNALEDFDLTWIEDPVRMDHLGNVGKITASSKTPIAVGELLGGRGQFRDLIEKSDLGLVIMDIVWGGGLTEARKVAAYCDFHSLPFSGHDCTGPVALAASTHMAMHAPNIFVQEVVRAFYYDWYQELVTNLPPIDNGYISAPEGSGLGMALNPDVYKRQDLRVRTSKLGE